MRYLLVALVILVAWVFAMLGLIALATGTTDFAVALLAVALLLLVPLLMAALDLFR